MSLTATLFHTVGSDRVPTVSDATVKFNNAKYAEPRPAEPITKKTTKILYNVASLDSMLAAAAVLSILTKCGSEATLVNYDRFVGLDFLSLPTELLIVGVELTPHDIEKLIKITDKCISGETPKDLQLVVNIMAYKNQYHRDQVRLEKMKERFLILRNGESEYYREEDDTMCRLVITNYREKVEHFELFQKWHAAVGRHTTGELLRLDYKDKALKQPYMSYGKQRSDVYHNQVTGVINGMLSERAGVLALRGLLSSSLTHQKPIYMLSSNEIKVNKSGLQQYRGRQQAIRLAVHKNMRKEYLGGGWFAKRVYLGGGHWSREQAMQVGVMPVTQELFADTAEVALRTQEIFLGYEDTKEHRIFRIACKDLSESERVAKALKPVDIWTEGNIVCVATHLPRHSIN